MSLPDPLETSVGAPDARELDLILERDPAGAYASMDVDTRERYRQACRELAVWSGKDAPTVAREAVQLSAEHDASDPRGRHVGARLIAEGRPRLEARLGCRAPWPTRISRLAWRHAANLYLGSLLGLLGLALFGVERFLAAREVELLHRVLLTACLSLSILELLQEGAEWVLSRLMTAGVPLPRLDPQQVFSRDTRTLVVTPLLIASAEDIETQLRMVEINYLGNVEPELFFALLTDFRDGQEKETPAERELLGRLEQGIRELNERHGYREQPRFFFFHRERRWNPVAKRWMGWERKRGKLEEFNRLVLGARDTSYVGDVPELVHTLRYVITLDADTHLLPGSAARMVATLHHPLNQARFDATGRRVIAGYAILQPNSEFSPTRARWLASGGWPVSIMRERRKGQPEKHWLQLQQRLFGTGAFLGKGLYDVAAFTRSLEGQIPENAVLSHDKLEGMYARVAFAHDIKLFESQPKDITVFARIWHRWLRGDWQLLPWLLPRVPVHSGPRAPNPLSLFDRWRLLSDLLRSLRYPSSLLVVAYGWLLLPSTAAAAWTLGATLWICRHSFVSALIQMLRNARASRSWVGGIRTVATAIPRILVGTFIRMASILPSSALVLDAIIRVLYRFAFDRSRMLDWITHAQSSRRARGLSFFSVPEVWGALVLALGLGGGLAVLKPETLPWASPLLVAWLPVMKFTSRERSARVGKAVTPTELDQLRALARSTWARYEQWDPTGRELPRGGLVEQGAHGGEAEVSPTDLALWLVAPVGAYHLGYLELGGLVSRLGESLSVIAALERHRGHLFDRYDVRERRRVGPRHITTAESGVLAAALVVVESGLRAARGAVTDPALMARLEEVEARARGLREEMDFAFLYDAAVDLLHVGHDVESGTLDGGHHGLLTSGAMLAGFMAIALKEVPLRHWLALAASDQRLRAAGASVTGRNALAEQLLPTLFLWFPPRTLLGQAALSTVDAGLGGRNEGAARPAEVAPHLSMLALRFRPEHALAGIRRGGEQGAPVAEAVVEPESSSRSQAVVLAAVANLACDDILIQHFHQHWQTAWVEGLVYETKEAP